MYLVFGMLLYLTLPYLTFLSTYIVSIRLSVRPCIQSTLVYNSKKTSWTIFRQQQRKKARYVTYTIYTPVRFFFGVGCVAVAVDLLQCVGRE